MTTRTLKQAAALALGLGAMIVAVLSPPLGMLTGLCVCGAAVVWPIRRRLRRDPYRTFPSESPAEWKPSLFVPLLFAFGAVIFLLGMGSRRLDLQKERQDRAAQVEAAREAARQRRALALQSVPGLLADAEAALTDGRLEDAQEITARIREIDAADGRLDDLQRRLDAAIAEQNRLAATSALAEADRKAAEQSWPEVLAACRTAAEFDPIRVKANAACTQAEAREERRLAEQARRLREADVKGWTREALAVARDRSRCTTPNDLLAAWTDLRNVRRDDPGFAEAKRAAAALERCRKATGRELQAGVRQLMKHGRQEWADRIEHEMLMKGADVRVTLHGKYGDHARVEWILIDRPTVYRLTRDPESIAGWEKIGLKKISFTDGYSETYSVTLNPTDESTAGQMALEKLGLGEPIRLGGR